MMKKGVGGGKEKEEEKGGEGSMPVIEVKMEGDFRRHKSKRAAIALHAAMAFQDPASKTDLKSPSNARDPRVHYKRQSISIDIQSAKTSDASAESVASDETATSEKKKKNISQIFRRGHISEEVEKLEREEKEKEMANADPRSIARSSKKDRSSRMGGSVMIRKDKDLDKDKSSGRKAKSLKVEDHVSKPAEITYSVAESTRVTRTGSHKCSKCEGKITKKTNMIQFLDGKRTYHVPCFTCYGCGVKLQSEYCLFGGNPHCVKCIEMKNPMCAECSLPIKGPATDAMGKKWHPEHFCCTHCHKPLNAMYDTQAFFVENCKPYCSDDYYELFGKRCSCGCSEIITKDILYYQNNAYKPRHFRCKHCANDLTSLDIDSIVVIAQPGPSNVLFCSNRCVRDFSPLDFKKQLEGKLLNLADCILKAGKEEICMWCDDVISRGQDNFRSPEGEVYHPNHLMCLCCGHAITKKFEYRDGEVFCDTCVAKRSGISKLYYSIADTSLDLPLPATSKCTVCDKRFKAGDKYIISTDESHNIFHKDCAFCDECEQKVTGKYVWKSGFFLCQGCWEKGDGSASSSKGKASAAGKAVPAAPLLQVSSAASASPSASAGGSQRNTLEIDYKRVNEEKKKSSGSSTCDWCDCVILINQLIVVSSHGRAYHIDHFHCKTCDNLIKNKFCWIKDHPYCPNCAPAKHGSSIKKKHDYITASSASVVAVGVETCDYCDTPIGKGERVMFTKELNRYYHRQHFMCFTCGLLVADKFKWVEGLQTCDTCCEKKEPAPAAGPVLTSSREGSSDFLTKAKASKINAKKAQCFTCQKDVRIGGSVVSSPLGISFHDECLKCNVCNNKIAQHFNWNDGFPVCRTCIELKGITINTSSPSPLRSSGVKRHDSSNRIALVLQVSNAEAAPDPRRPTNLDTGTRARAGTTVITMKQPEKAIVQAEDDAPTGWKNKVGVGKMDRADSKDTGMVYRGLQASNRAQVVSAQPVKGNSASVVAAAAGGDKAAAAAKVGGKTLDLPPATTERRTFGGEQKTLNTSADDSRSRRGTRRGSFTLTKEAREDYVRLLNVNDVEAAVAEASKPQSRASSRLTLTRGSTMTALFANEQPQQPLQRGRVPTKRFQAQDTRMLPESVVVENIETVIEIQHVLGRGGFATVKAAVDLKTKEVVAVKTFNKWELKGQTLIFLKREVSALSQISHPNIVKLHQVVEDLHFVYLIVEYIKGENLFERLESNFTITEKQTQTVVRRLLECLDFLHSRSIIHQDIKTENMMLPTAAPDPFDAAKLIDFGFARPVRPDELLEEYCGSVDYLAPEIIDRRPYHLAVDIWAAGCVMYNCLTGLRPFFSPQEASEGKIQWFDDDWDNLTPQAKDLVIHLLVVDPKTRYTARNALNHEWFKIEISDHAEESDEDDEEDATPAEDGAGDAAEDDEPIFDNLEDSVRDALESQTCVGCLDVIEEGGKMVFSPLGTAYHVACFRCLLCAHDITDEYVWRKGSPFCGGCFGKIAAGQMEYLNVKAASSRVSEAAPCLWCEKEIPRGQVAVVSRDGQAFHPGCLVCEECSEAVANEFVWKRGIPCCRGCWERMFPPPEPPKILSVRTATAPAARQGTCAWCEKAIGVGSPVLFSKEEYTFHPDCLVCSDCSQVAKGEFVWQKGIPCCRPCFEKTHPGVAVAAGGLSAVSSSPVRFLSIDTEAKAAPKKESCLWCEGDVAVGEKVVISSDGSAFHPECLMCDECAQVAKEFVWRDGIPCCRKCWEKANPPEAASSPASSASAHIIVAKDAAKPATSACQCMWCEKNIGVGGVCVTSADGSAFHLDCLMCDECSEVAKEFVWRDGIPCCRKCWEKANPPAKAASAPVAAAAPTAATADGTVLSAKTEAKPVSSANQCMWCEKKIPVGERAVVSKEGNAFHPACLMCDECSEVAVEFVWREGIPCCRTCWEKANPPSTSSSSASPSAAILSAKSETKPASAPVQCLWCEKSIPRGEGVVLSPDGNAFHPICLMCDECSEVAERFVWRDGIPCCESCLNKKGASPAAASDPTHKRSSSIDAHLPVVPSPLAKELDVQSFLTASKEAVAASAALECLWCDGKIAKGQLVVVSKEGNAFHPQCLMCNECSQVAKEFVWADGLPLCRACREKKVTPRPVRPVTPPPSSSPAESVGAIISASTAAKPLSGGPSNCMWCEKTVPVGEKVVVSKEGNVFHPDCLMCDECSEVAKEFVWRDGIPCCRKCWGKANPPAKAASPSPSPSPSTASTSTPSGILSVRTEGKPVSSANQCMWCEKKIAVGEIAVVSKEGNAFHPACLMCDECSEVAVEFVWREGIPCCRACWEKANPPKPAAQAKPSPSPSPAPSPSPSPSSSSLPAGILTVATEAKAATSPSQCMWCEKSIPIGGTAVLSKEGFAFHPTCLMCDECSEVAKEFVWRNGIPCCRKCWEKISSSSAKSHTPAPAPSPSSAPSPSPSPSPAPVSSALKPSAVPVPKPSTAANSSANLMPAGKPAVTQHVPAATSFPPPKQSPSPSAAPDPKAHGEKSASFAQSRSLPPLQQTPEVKGIINTARDAKSPLSSPHPHSMTARSTPQSAAAPGSGSAKPPPKFKVGAPRAPAPAPANRVDARTFTSVNLVIQPIFGSQKCSSCGEVLGQGKFGISSPSRTYYHQPCFTCCDCKSLVDGDFIWNDGAPKCRKCVEKA